MTITVDIVRPDIAVVTRAPSLLARMLFRRTGEDRTARRVLVITGGFRWIWDDSSERVDDATCAAIERAALDLRRQQLRHALEPPS